MNVNLDEIKERDADARVIKQLQDDVINIQQTLARKVNKLDMLKLVETLEKPSSIGEQSTRQTMASLLDTNKFQELEKTITQLQTDMKQLLNENTNLRKLSESTENKRITLEVTVSQLRKDLLNVKSVPNNDDVEQLKRDLMNFKQSNIIDDVIQLRRELFSLKESKHNNEDVEQLKRELVNLKQTNNDVVQLKKELSNSNENKNNNDEVLQLRQKLKENNNDVTQLKQDLLSLKNNDVTQLKQDLLSLKNNDEVLKLKQEFNSFKHDLGQLSIHTAEIPKTPTLDQTHITDIANCKVEISNIRNTVTTLSNRIQNNGFRAPPPSKKGR
jgi:hypothetical protein